METNRQTSGGEAEMKDERPAYVWIDEFGRTKFTIDLDDLFKVLNGKKIIVQVMKNDKENKS